MGCNLVDNEDGSFSIECTFEPQVQWTDEQPEHPPVWLTEYRTYGFLIQEGSHVSLIRFFLEGERVDEQVENDEWETWEAHAIEHFTD